MDRQTVRNVRLYYGLTQEEFAERVGVSASFIAAVESGYKGVSDKLRMKIALAFDINEEIVEAVHRSNLLKKIAEA